MKMTPGQGLGRSTEFTMKREIISASKRYHVIGAVLATCALLAAGSIELHAVASSSQLTFASPDDASRALASAVQQRDDQAVRAILGGGSELVSSNDEAEDTL